MQTNIYYKVMYVTKEEMIEAIENAKSVHLEQMQKIRDEIKGKKIEDPTALGKMECECGIWFHKNEQRMKEICGLQLFERLDASHEKWHNDYANIYKLFYVEEKKGLFTKLKETLSSNEMMKLDKAKLYYAELQKDTEELINTSDIALRRVKALSESKFS